MTVTRFTLYSNALFPLNYSAEPLSESISYTIRCGHRLFIPLDLLALENLPLRADISPETLRCILPLLIPFVTIQYYNREVLWRGFLSTFFNCSRLITIRVSHRCILQIVP